MPRIAGEDAREAVVEVLELEVQPHAGAALVEVTLHLARIASREAAAHERAEVADRELAVGRGRGDEVLLQVGLAQSLARSVRQGRDAVRAHAKHRRDLGGLLALDVEVPQHHLPALGQRRERLGGGGALEAELGGVDEVHAAVELELVVGGTLARDGADAVDVQAAHRGQQVGPERLLGTAAVLHGDEDLGERLGDEVVGVGAAHELAGQALGRGLVTGIQLAVGTGVTTAHGGEQIGVAALLPEGRRRGVEGHCQPLSRVVAKQNARDLGQPRSSV